MLMRTRECCLWLDTAACLQLSSASCSTQCHRLHVIGSIRRLCTGRFSTIFLKADILSSARQEHQVALHNPICPIPEAALAGGSIPQVALVSVDIHGAQAVGNAHQSCQEAVLAVVTQPLESDSTKILLLLLHERADLHKT